MACLYAGSYIRMAEEKTYISIAHTAKPTMIARDMTVTTWKWKSGQTFPSRKFSLYIISYWVEGKVCPTKPWRWWLQPDMLIYYETQERTNLLLMSLTNSSFHNNLHSTPHTVQLSIISQAQFCFADMREQFLAGPSQLTWSKHWGLECPHIP